MKARSIVLGSIISAGLIAGGFALAQPERNVNPGRHPNLAAAQRLVDQAYQRISDAQQANEWDMHGHASKAKELLDQASRELKAAAEEANHRH